MKKLNVLIVDDSVVYRTQIKTALTGYDWIDIVGVAANGKIALDKVATSKIDLLILDVEMPEMDGLQTLQQMKSLHLFEKTKVIMFSSASKRGAEITLECLRLGASDFITKPGADSVSIQSQNPSDLIRDLVLPKIQALFPEFSQQNPYVNSSQLTSISGFKKLDFDLVQPNLLVIASSTGGPTVLENIFSAIKGDLNIPIIIVQHMPALFTTTLAERITKMSGHRVVEAKNGDLLQAGNIYIAPGDYHLTLTGSESSALIQLNRNEHVNFVRPAADVTIKSALEIFGSRMMVMVLTGMGADGKEGCIQAKNKGCFIAIQEKNSCTVFGMPGAIYDANIYDDIWTPEQISLKIRNKFFQENIFLKVGGIK